MASFYWERHPDGPFATLIAVATTYLDPENYHLDSLKELARREDDEEMRVFKSELREALRDPASYRATSFSSQSSTTMAATRRSCSRLWHDLYGRRAAPVPRRHTDRSHPGGSLAIRSPSSERSARAFALSAPSLAENSQSSTTSITSFTLPARSSSSAHVRWTTI